jgi:hypothetical protein
MKESANDRNDFLLKEPRLRKCRCRWKPRKHRWEDSPRFFRMEYAAAAAHAPVHLLPRAFTRPPPVLSPAPFLPLLLFSTGVLAAGLAEPHHGCGTAWWPPPSARPLRASCPVARTDNMRPRRCSFCDDAKAKYSRLAASPNGPPGRPPCLGLARACAGSQDAGLAWGSTR